MKKSLIRLAVIALSIGALGRMAISHAQSSSGSGSSGGGGGCCGKEEKPTTNTDDSFKGMKCGEGTLFDPKTNQCVKVVK